MSEEGEIPQIETSSEAVETKKERVKKPARPEDDAYKQKIEALQDTINQSKAKIEKIKQTLDDRRGGRTKGSSEQQVLKNKLAELRNQFQSILKNKIQMRAQMDAAIKTRESVKASLRDLRSTMKFTTVEEIDEHIEQLESRMQHTTLSLVEEKRILEDIRKLKASRNTVGEYSERLEALSYDDTTRSELQSGIKALDDQLNAIKVKEEELREELGKMREKDQQQNGDVPTLMQEKEELKEVSKQAYDKIKELRAEQDAKWTEFKAQEKLWRAQQNEDRKIRQQRYDEERAAKAAERAARAAENAPEPFDKEVTMCEQLVNYLSKYVESTATNTEEEKKEVAALDGMKALAKSSVDDEDAWLLGKGKAGGKGKGKKGGAKEGGGKQQEIKLSHTFDILEAFTALKVTVPATASAVPPVLEDVKSKKEVYLKKREEVKEKAASEPAATDAADATDAPTSSEDQPANGDTSTSTTTTDKSNSGKNNNSDATRTPKEKKSGGGKSKNAPDTPALKLDDSASWPAVGAEATTAIAAATTATTAAADDDDNNQQEEEDTKVEETEEVVTTPEAPSAAAAVEQEASGDVAVYDVKPPTKAEEAGSGQRVAFTIDGDTVSISINHDD